MVSYSEVGQKRRSGKFHADFPYGDFWGVIRDLSSSPLSGLGYKPIKPEYPFCAYSHPKTYAAYPVVSIEFRPGLFEVVVRLVSAVQRGRCAGFACPSYLATDTYPARPLLST